MKLKYQTLHNHPNLRSFKILFGLRTKNSNITEKIWFK